VLQQEEIVIDIAIEIVISTAVYTWEASQTCSKSGQGYSTISTLHSGILQM
jgi:hypothetical protein